MNRSPVRLTGFYGYSFIIAAALTAGDRFTYREVVALMDEKRQIIPMDAYLISSVECDVEQGVITVNITRRNR